MSLSNVFLIINFNQFVCLYVSNLYLNIFRHTHPAFYKKNVIKQRNELSTKLLISWLKLSSLLLHSLFELII